MREKCLDQREKPRPLLPTLGRTADWLRLDLMDLGGVSAARREHRLSSAPSSPAHQEEERNKREEEGREFFGIYFWLGSKGCHGRKNKKK